MSYILAHDLGTTGNKANLFDETGALVASHLESYPVAYPQPQWAEQDPNDWWRAVCVSTRALLSQVPDARERIAAVAFSGQMMGVVAVDARQTPLCSAIIWADQRATGEADWIAERIGADQVYERTGASGQPRVYCRKNSLAEGAPTGGVPSSKHIIVRERFCGAETDGRSAYRLFGCVGQ